MTNAAYDKNIELGVLCRGDGVASQVQRHFDALIARGVLEPVELSRPGPSTQVSTVGRVATAGHVTHPTRGFRPVVSIRSSKAGTYQIRYRDPNGRQRARNFTRKTDATRFAASVETDKVRGDWLDPRLGKVTSADWADEWLGQLGHLKPKTRLDYEVNLRRNVLPLLGDAPVGSIDRPTMKTFTSDLTAGGAAPTSFGSPPRWLATCCR